MVEDAGVSQLCNDTFNEPAFAVLLVNIRGKKDLHGHFGKDNDDRRTVYCTLIQNMVSQCLQRSHKVG